MIRLMQLRLRNFLSHRDTIIDLDDLSGLVLIEGNNVNGKYNSNGSGKSTILEGIIYALTGNTLRGVSVNDVINRTAGKDTRVTLSLERNNIVYDIHRHRKDTIKGDKLEVYKETLGERVCISKRLNKDTQSFIDSIIGIPYDILINTIFLGEGLSSRFTQLSDADKKSLIESTLSLNYDLNKSRESVNQKLKSLRIESARLDGCIKTLEDLTQEADYRKLLEESTKDLEELDSKLYTINSFLSNINQNIEISENKFLLLKEHLVKVDELYKNILSLDDKNTILLSKIDSVLHQVHRSCPLCKQSLDTEESLEEVVNTYRKEIDDNLNIRISLDEVLKNFPDRVIIEEKSRIIQEELNNLLSKKIYHESEYNELSCKRFGLVRDIKHYDDMLKNYDNRLLELNNNKKSLLSINKEIKDYEYLYKLYSPTGIMVHVLEDAISYINSRIKVYTEILLDRQYELSIEKGKILLVDSRGASYQSLSNGEKRRLDVSIQFSLHDYTTIYCGNSCKTLFIDEIMDSLDDIGVSNILDVLSMKKDYCKLKNIFVITHNNTLKNYFDNVVNVVKDNFGDSYIK